MSKRYCFQIRNKKEIKLDRNKLDELLKFITKLYTDNSDEKDNLSFFAYHSRGIHDDNVCIQMTGRGQRMNDKIKEINEMLGKNPSMLDWEDDISLSEPYEYDDTQGQGFPLKLEKTKGQKRWSSIVQRGPYFKEIMEPYVPLNAKLSIKGKIYNLNPEEEKVAGFYASRMIADAKDIAKTQYTKLEQFNKNFWKDFQEYLTPKAKSIFKSYNDFLQIDWSDLIQKLEQKTLAEKELAKTKKEKDRKKQKNAEIKSEYGYAILDGKPRQKIGNYQVEMSGIFLGKKGHSKLGSIKKQIMPEDVTINIGENDPRPDPPSGHRWKVVHDYTKVWLASWKDEINNKIKYIWFSPEGVFKAQSDFNKYEKARKLHFQIEEIRTKYMILAESLNMINKQIGTVLFLIDRFGIRIGNETESDKTDPVVGATTLLVSNINVDKKNIVIFDFEGKDNVPFYKELKVPENIYKNFKQLKEGKNDRDQLFDKISSDTVNEYIKQEFDPSFSAKVFRTRLGSEIMYNALQDLDPIPPKSKKTDIKKEFNKANIKVAEVLNHVRTATTTKSMETLKNALKEAEKEKNTEKINKLTKQIEEKQVLMSVAINTSLVNYIDPRIVASWAKSQNVPINSVYNSTLEAKFNWAIQSTDKEWSWEESPLEEGEEEEDEEQGEEPPKKSRTRRSVIREKLPPKTETPFISSRRPPKTETPFIPSRRPPKSEKIPSRHPPPKSEKIPSRHPPKTQIPESPTKTETLRRRYKMPVRRIIDEDYKIEQELKKATVQNFKFNWQENIVESPEVLESYKLLLELCQKLKSGKNNNYELISKIDAKVLKWVYPLSKEIVKNIDNTSIYYKPNKYIIDYCDKKMFNSTPTPPFPIPPSSGPIFTPTPSPSPLDLQVGDSVIRRGELCTIIAIDRSVTPFNVTVQNKSSGSISHTEISLLSLPVESTPTPPIGSRTPLFTPTPSPSAKSEPLFTPTPPLGSRTPLFTPTPSPSPKSEPLFTPTPPSPKKAKPKAKKIKPNKITEARFRYLNTYNKEDLKEYCESHKIECKGKNINEMRENVMKFFEFDPDPDPFPKKIVL